MPGFAVRILCISAESIFHPWSRSIIYDPSFSTTQANELVAPRSEAKDGLRTTFRLHYQVTYSSNAPIVVSQTFKMIFWAVVFLIFFSGLADLFLATTWLKPTVLQQGVFDGFGFAWRAGTGALFGLLGGKAA